MKFSFQVELNTIHDLILFDTWCNHEEEDDDDAENEQGHGDNEPTDARAEAVKKAVEDLFDALHGSRDDDSDDDCIMHFDDAPRGPHKR